MKKLFEHAQKYMFRGLLAIIPLLLCGFCIQLLYVLIDKRIMGFLANFFDVRQIPGLGILIFLVSLYLIGLVVGNFVGRQVFKFFENLSKRIPLIKAIYGIGKQLSDSLDVTDKKKKAFKKAVLVKMDNSGMMTPAFVMGSKVSPKTGEEYLFVLVASAPTPASGFVLVVKASQTIDPGWSVEECLKFIVSMGLVVPSQLKVE